MNKRIYGAGGKGSKARRKNFAISLIKGEVKVRGWLHWGKRNESFDGWSEWTFVTWQWMISQSAEFRHSKFIFSLHDWHEFVIDFHNISPFSDKIRSSHYETVMKSPDIKTIPIFLFRQTENVVFSQQKLLLANSKPIVEFGVSFRLGEFNSIHAGHWLIFFYELPLLFGAIGTDKNYRAQKGSKIEKLLKYF